MVVAVATPAAAQSTYIGASLVGDFARFSKVDYDDDSPRILWDDGSSDLEALGFNLKIGRALGERWGVELEFARSGEMESRMRPVVLPAELRSLPPQSTLPILIADIQIEQEQRHIGLGALAWVRQDLGARVDLSYLGGVVFSRWETEHDYEVTISRPAIYPPIRNDFTTITYGITPAVGVEAALKLGDAGAVTTGVRLQGTAGRNGWLVRPNVGFRWMF